MLAPPAAVALQDQGSVSRQIVDLRFEFSERNQSRPFDSRDLVFKRLTHIDELKDEFPVRINIVKTGNGSRIVMAEE